MTRCENLGAYNLVKELAIEDDMAFSNYLRINHDLFKMISEKISPLIYRRDTNMRKAMCRRKTCYYSTIFATGIII